MFRGRVLLVGVLDDAASLLEPVIRDGGHLALSVAGGEEALQVLEEGIIPDIVVGDTRPAGWPREPGYLHRFRQLNQLGQLLLVADRDAPPPALETLTALADAPTLLHLPLDPAELRAVIEESMDRIRQGLLSLRGELFREAARLQQAIREAHLEIVTALALTMEAKDPYMHGHCARVAELSREIADELRIAEEERETLRVAALLHEIGKISVPVELLLEPRRLSPEELERVRAHTRVGAQIVSAVPSLRHLAPLLQHLHTPYAELAAQLPDDASELLPLAGILRVADVYDAMTSDRSYRNPVPLQERIAVLVEGAGRDFHAEAVDALIRVLQREAAPLS